MRNFSKLIMIVICLAVLSTGCGGRVPSAKTARSTSLGYFNSYGKKYPATTFGSKNLSNITINEIQELSYKFALVDELMAFADGHEARALVRLERKFPGGWTVVSWEMLGMR